MKHSNDIIRIFSESGRYNNDWNVEAMWHGKPRIVHAGKSIYKVLKWAKEHGYYE